LGQKKERTWEYWKVAPFSMSLTWVCEIAHRRSNKISNQVMQIFEREKEIERTLINLCKDHAARVSSVFFFSKWLLFFSLLLFSLLSLSPSPLCLCEFKIGLHWEWKYFHKFQMLVLCYRNKIQCLYPSLSQHNWYWGPPILYVRMNLYTKFNQIYFDFWD
jgi:hypothetical protein